MGRSGQRSWRNSFCADVSVANSCSSLRDGSARQIPQHRAREVLTASLTRIRKPTALRDALGESQWNGKRLRQFAGVQAAGTAEGD